jgi:dephospho-CoA kinase
MNDQDSSIYRPLLIGLTGPIGCGKSTVARWLGELGGTVIDADALARRATEPGRQTLAHIRRRFGNSVFAPNGELDRAAMARVVFADAEALRDLESIVHPEVRVMVDEALDSAASDQVPFVVIEAIKLVEGGLAERCDEVWLIECSVQSQRERLSSRSGDRAHAEQRISAQGGDLVDRLERMLTSRAFGGRVLRLSADGDIDGTRDLVEDMLAEAFEAGSRT